MRHYKFDMTLASYIKPLDLTKCISKLSAKSPSFVIEGNLRFKNLNSHHPTNLNCHKK